MRGGGTRHPPLVQAEDREHCSAIRKTTATRRFRTRRTSGTLLNKHSSQFTRQDRRKQTLRISACAPTHTSPLNKYHRCRANCVSTVSSDVDFRQFHMGQMAEFQRKQEERMTGVEPASTAWEAVVLPMNYIRRRRFWRTSGQYTRPPPPPKPAVHKRRLFASTSHLLNRASYQLNSFAKLLLSYVKMIRS